MTTTTTEQHKPKKQRSPNFPCINLEEALGLTEKVYKAENLGFAPVHVVVTKHWGYGAKSSAWKLRLAALVSFGLLDAKGEGDAKQVRLSELAKKILLDRVPGSAERKQALRDAALAPKIYKEIREKWGKQLGSDATVETYLVKDREFTDTAARTLIADYKATIAFAQLDDDDIVAPQGEGDLKASGGGTPAVLTPKKPQRPTPATGMRDFPITLPSLAVATLQVPVPMTKADFTWLKSTLVALEVALTANANTSESTGDDDGDEDEQP